MDRQFRKVDGIFGRVSAIHHSHEGGEVAVGGGHGRAEKLSDQLILEAGFADGAGQMIDDLAVGVVEVEVAEDQLVIGAHQGLEDERTHFLVAGLDGNRHVYLQHLVVVRDGPTDFVNGRLAAHGEGDEFFVMVDVAFDVVLFAVGDKGVEGSGKAVHTMRRAQDARGVQISGCHKGVHGRRQHHDGRRTPTAKRVTAAPDILMIGGEIAIGQIKGLIVPFLVGFIRDGQ